MGLVLIRLCLAKLSLCRPNSANFANFWKFFQFFILKIWEKYHAMPSTYTFSNKNKNMKWRKWEKVIGQWAKKCPRPSLITHVHQASLSTLLTPFHHKSKFYKLHDVQTRVGGFFCFNENCEFLSFLTLERTNPIYF